VELKERFKKLRKAVGLKHEEMEAKAEAAGHSLARTEIVKIENGANQLSRAAKRQAVAVAFDMKEEDIVAYLIDGSIDLDEARRRRQTFIEQRERGEPKPYGDSPTWRQYEPRARQHPMAGADGFDLPDAAFHLTRSMPAIRGKQSYGVLDILAIVAFYWVTAEDHEIRRAETELAAQEERDEQKVRPIVPSSTPPEPLKRKGPAVRSAHSPK
jgi:hypothetical protein